MEHNSTRLRGQHGIALTEFVIVAPLLFLVMLGIVQFCLISHAKSQVYYATYEAARAGSSYDPKKTSQTHVMKETFERAIIGYYGGGTNQAEIDSSRSQAQRDLSEGLVLTSKITDDQYLTVKATFGIPDNKQVYFAGPILIMTLQQLGLSGDLGGMVNKGRIPVTAEVTMHLSPIAMQTPTWKKNK